MWLANENCFAMQRYDEFDVKSILDLELYQNIYAQIPDTCRNFL